MGVYIRGMEMPTEGGTIVVYKITGKFFAARAGKDELCPLVHVPPHGRMIDADALLRDNKSAFVDRDGYPEFSYSAVTDAPTIIPAEEGET